ncbi:MAG: HlyD family type I secretion periplasmic adaptor subunit [Sphingomonadales bacterium]|nr:HlyD family type I secretion periplasmic adaptor subunit [Sphingomonadales bacterium]
MTQGTELITGYEDVPERGDFTANKSANVLLWVIAAFFAAFFIWAAFTKVERTVHGSGRVVPSSKMQIVSNLEGGVVQEILIKPGQVVKQGDVLVRLSPTLTSSELGSNAASIDALRAKIARLRGEVTGTAPNYTGVSAAAAATESALHRARMAELNSLSGGGSARSAQAERAVAEAEAILDARRGNLAAAQKELDMLRPLAARQIVSRLDLVKAENAVAVAGNEVTAAVASVARARAAIAEARSGTAQARSDWLGRSGAELAAAQSELAAREKATPALADRVDRTIIRAPLTGRVNRVLVTTIGGTVSAGMPLVEIVPSDEALYVEAMVLPQDIGNVRLGQNAKIEITAYRATVYGKLEGEVVTISPDVVINEKTGESFYTVEVKTTSKLTGPDGKELPIGPGMVANISLLGDARSILSYIFTPFTQLKENAFRE